MLQPNPSHPITPKLWGHETLIINTPEYCGKVLTVVPGFQCSLHLHEVKDETFLVVSGVLVVEYYPDGDPEDRRVVELGEGASLRLTPGTPHRFWSGEDGASFIEFSTHDSPEDSIRLEESRPR